MGNTLEHLRLVSDFDRKLSWQILQGVRVQRATSSVQCCPDESIRKRLINEMSASYRYGDVFR